MSDEVLKAPYPAFGGKGRPAPEVWRRFGADASNGGLRNYVEPFAFSAAALLRRPGGAGPVETINDRNHFVANFWRAVKADPEGVARHADWPVNEADLHARHKWLVASDQANARLAKVGADPEFYDVKIAGWWCWGACCWIGSGWCDETHRNSASATRPDLEGQMVTVSEIKRPALFNGNTAGGPGVHRVVPTQLPDLTDGSNGGVCGKGVHRKRPMIATEGDNGRGVHGAAVLPPDDHRPQLADEFSRGRGVNGWMDGYTCEQRRVWVTEWMYRLADRLRTVRVCCGHWMRVCDSPSTMTRLGLTGVFLDPPYRTTLADGARNRTRHIYANDKIQDVNALCDEVQAWCVRWCQDPMVRIALCGLEGEYPEIEATVGKPGGWTVYAWKSNGGYGNRAGGDANVNRARERIWFSPHCLPEVAECGTGGLFGG